VEPAGEPSITSADIERLRQARSRNKYSDFSDDEREAHARVHSALNVLGHLALDRLGGSVDYVLKLTAGYHPASGIRGGKPKDLWFGIYRKQNGARFLGNPQIFMIVSGRGIEYGFAPLTHPDDFSNQDIRRKTRQIAREVLQQMPAPGSTEAIELEERLSSTGRWHYRRKQRLDPNQSEYRSLNDWLTFVRSEPGIESAGGGITRYLLPDELGRFSLAQEVTETVEVFGSLIQSVVADDNPILDDTSSIDSRSFRDVLKDLLSQLSEARKSPFQLSDALRISMASLRASLGRLPAIAERSDILASVSVGQGNWAAVPWIALLNTTVTRSTQEGIYVVLLISKSLDRMFLTLNQGTTNLVKELGQRGAQQYMLEVAEKARKAIPELQSSGFALDNNIDLGSEDGWLAKNYEIGTIAHIDFRTDDLPDDERLNSILAALLSAYDKVIEAAPSEPQEPIVPDANPATLEPYDMEDALADLFLDQAALERLLAIWGAKKNLILQGAPGVGKSFVARRLAYLLLGSKDSGRIATVQFHQSYSYEDFVQGYRPDGSGGFVLRDGVFYAFCKKAALSPERIHVFIVDEINRGNLSKILGELMLLVESDKRGPAWASTLTYARPEDPPFFVPENVRILGMMNTADRSLSMVDYALRRRFSFVSLEPMFGSDKFRRHLGQQGVPSEVVSAIITQMTALNHAIGDDKANLGPGYRIGHSFFVPSGPFEYKEGWYRQVIETEILPLLEEYWFDDDDKAASWRGRLLQGAP
jgi:MoxR-like ATPase